MQPDFSRLATSWDEWANRAQLTHVGASDSRDDGDMAFTSDDASFYLRLEDGWWVLDEVDDRGKRYPGTARFSTFELVERYLIWTWASVARSLLGAEQLGRQLHSLGVKAGVEVLPTDREYVMELRLRDGVAILPASKVPVFSHVLDMPLHELDQMIRQGIG
ncbi:hypothetical protein AU198_19205 [Mycobacterium sp. GA-1199]|nr:hypothetical protein AU198_19205 [Mycobacterium sp. GA-1199]